MFDRGCELPAGVGQLFLDDLEADHVDHHVRLIEISPDERGDVEALGVEVGVGGEPGVLAVGQDDHGLKPFGVVEVELGAPHRLDQRGAVERLEGVELAVQVFELFGVPGRRLPKTLDRPFRLVAVEVVGTSRELPNEPIAGLAEGDDAKPSPSGNRTERGLQGLLGFLKLRLGRVYHASGAIEDERDRAVAFAKPIDHGGVGPHGEARLRRGRGTGVDRDDLRHRVDHDGRLAFKRLAAEEPFDHKFRLFPRWLVAGRVALRLPDERAGE